MGKIITSGSVSHGPQANDIGKALGKLIEAKRLEVDEDKALDLLMKGRCRLLTQQSWYGTMASLFEWRLSERVPTIGVRFLKGGRVECLWNPYFIMLSGGDMKKFSELVERGQIDKAAAEMRPMTVPQVIDVVKHEIEHIVRLHPGRHGARDHDLMNIAADMAIHGHKKSGRFPNMPIDVFFLPDDMSEELTAEEIYEALYQKHGGGKGKVGKGGNGNGKPLPDGHLCDDHSIWDGSEASEDEARQVVKDMVDRASKMAGQQPGHLKKAIEELEEPQILWKYLLRQWLGRQAGGRRSTWARINRRHQTFGVKGHSCHARTKLTIWADLSGSVWGNVKMVEQFFSEIEAASHAYEVTIVMFDYSIQSVERYHRGGWRNIEPKGGGGTRFIFADMADEYKSKNGLFGQINVVLTDGYAEFPDKEIAPFIWAIVSTDVEPPKHIKAIHIK